METEDDGRKQGEGPVLQLKHARLAAEGHGEAGQQGDGVGEVGLRGDQRGAGAQARQRLVDQRAFPREQDMPGPVEAHGREPDLRQGADGMILQPVRGRDIAPHVQAVGPVRQQPRKPQERRAEQGGHGGGADRGAEEFPPAPAADGGDDPGGKEKPEAGPHRGGRQPGDPRDGAEQQETAPAAEHADEGTLRGHEGGAHTPARHAQQQSHRSDGQDSTEHGVTFWGTGSGHKPYGPMARGRANPPDEPIDGSLTTDFTDGTDGEFPNPIIDPFYRR